MYAVVLNADTGAVLAMAGQKHEKGAQDFKADALGTITDVFIPGSVVKGATLTAGWRSGVIYGNQVLTDQPINIAGSAPITSWYSGLRVFIKYLYGSDCNQTPRPTILSRYGFVNG